MVAAASLAWPLVGRSEEVARVAEVMGRADPSGIALVGSTGVGKSRVADACGALADQLGLGLATVVATAAASTIPLGALSPLLPSSTPATVGPADHLRWMGDALCGAVPGRRLLLVVDDAHLLDDASAAVVHSLALERRACCLVTVRSDEQVPDLVRALWTEGLVERLELGPLSSADVGLLLDEVLGAVDGRARRDLCAASEGNPLLLHEIVVGALEGGALRNEEGVWTLTGSLSPTPRLVESVEARLVGVTDDEQRALELLAVGEPLWLDLLQGLVPAASIDELARRGLVSIRSEQDPVVVRLAHPLYGEVVRRGLTPLRRIAVSRELGQAAGKPRGAHDVVRLAVWRLDGGVEVGADLLLHAARVAHSAHDEVLAERLARAARDAGGGIEPTLLLTQILGITGRHEERLPLLRYAAIAARTDEQRAKVAMEEALALFWGLDRAGEAVAVLDRSTTQLPDGEWRDEVVGLLATLELLGGRPVAALEQAAPLLARGVVGRPFVEAATASVTALAVVGRCLSAIELSERALAVHVDLDDQEVLSSPSIHVAGRVFALGEAGRLAEAASAAAAAYEQAVEDRDRDGQAWMALLAGRVALLTGDLRAGLRSFTESAALYAELGEPGVRRWALAGMAIAAAWLGDADTADRAIDHLDRISSPMLLMETDVLRGRAWHASVAGDPGKAIDCLHDAVRVAAAAGARSLEAGAWHDLARLGRASEAAGPLRDLAVDLEGELVVARALFASGVAQADAPGLAAASAEFQRLGAMQFAAEASAAAAAASESAGADAGRHESPG